MNDPDRNETPVSFYVFAILLMAYGLLWFAPGLFPFKPGLLFGFSSALFAVVGGLGGVILICLARGYAFARPLADQALLMFLLLVMAEFALSVLGLPPDQSLTDRERERINRNIVAKMVGDIDRGERGYHHIKVGDLNGTPYLTGFEDKTVVFQEEDDGLIEFRTDENGYRNAPGVYSARDSFDAVIFGDSFAHGCCVPDDQMFAAYFADITGQSVYNLGYSGTGLLYALAAYMEYAQPKAPRNIVFQILEGASYTRTGPELDTHKYDSYLDAAARGARHSVGLSEERSGGGEKEDFLWRSVFKASLQRINRLTAERAGPGLTESDGSFFAQARAELQSLKLFRMFQDVKRAMIDRGGVPSTEKYPKCENFAAGHRMRRAASVVLEYLASEAAARGGKLILVFQPSFRLIRPEFPECERAFFRDFADAHKGTAVFVDLVEVLRETPDPLDYYYSLLRKGWPHAHFNARGYELAARATAAAMGAEK